MTRSMMRGATAFAASAAVVAGLLLSGCGAGQVTQTEGQQPPISGVNVNSADDMILLRNLAIEYAGIEGYEAGRVRTRPRADHQRVRERHGPAGVASPPTRARSCWRAGRRSRRRRPRRQRPRRHRRRRRRPDLPPDLRRPAAAGRRRRRLGLRLAHGTAEPQRAADQPDDQRRDPGARAGVLDPSLDRSTCRSPA